MRFELPINPDPHKYLYIFEGDEMIAEKPPGQNWRVKVSKCNQCGECCRRFHINHEFPPIKDGCCTLLSKVGYCLLERHRPFKCIVSTPIGDYCSVKFKQLK